MVDRYHTGNGQPALLALAVVLVAVFYVFPLALNHPLLDPDEGLHAAVAQEMVERGDWLVPRLLGEPFWDKPALFTWLQALSLRWLGMSEAAVRLPGLLAGLIAVISTGWAARRLLGPQAAVLAAVFYATLLLPAGLSQAATTDAVLVPVVTCALVLLWEPGQSGGAGSKTGRVLAAGGVLGIGCLAKGLVGIALVGVAYGAYLVMRVWLDRQSIAGTSADEKGVGQRDGRKELLYGLGRLSGAAGIALVVAAPWYLAMEVRNPGYLHYYFIDRHLRGFVTAGQPHGDQPWWYYLPVLLGGGLPWLAWLPAAARHTWACLRARAWGPQTYDNSDACASAADGSESSPDRTACNSLRASAGRPARGVSMARGAPMDGMLLAWCWLAGDVLLLSLGGSKLATYLWPVFPAIAILAAGLWAAALGGHTTAAVHRALRRTMLLTACLTPAGLPLVMWIVGSRFGLQFAWPTWGLAVAASATAWWGVWFVWRAVCGGHGLRGAAGGRRGFGPMSGRAFQPPGVPACRPADGGPTRRFDRVLFGPLTARPPGPEDHPAGAYQPAAATGAGRVGGRGRARPGARWALGTSRRCALSEGRTVSAL